jgi:Fe-Mn family superoxide dismutase
MRSITTSTTSGVRDNLNAALEKHPELQSKSVEDLLKRINTVPEDIRTGGAQQRRRPRQPHDVLGDHGPGRGGEPTGAVADAIKSRSAASRSSRTS